jgi:hypothetical protein
MRKDLERLQNALKQIKNPPKGSPEERYKQEMAAKLMEIDSLKKSINSQASAMSLYDKQLKEHQAMAEDLRLWGNYAKGKGEIGDYDWAVEEAIQGKIGKGGFEFMGPDKKRISITGGDWAATANWKEADYAPKPKGERPVVDPETQKILEKKERAYNQQMKSGFSTTPQTEVVESRPVNIGAKVWDDKKQKYVYTSGEQSYRTKK